MENKNMRNKSGNQDKTARTYQADSPFIHCEHDGFTYELPKRTNVPLVFCDNVELMFTSERDYGIAIINGDNRDFVALHPEEIYTLTVTLSDTEKSPDNVGECLPCVALFRKKEKRALLCKELYEHSDYFELPVSNLHLTAGDYFIVLYGVTPEGNCVYEMEEMAGMYTLHFSIKEHGCRMVHPVLEHELAKNFPVLVLRPSSGELKSQDEYRYVCYNRVYRHVFNNTCTVSDNQLTIKLMDLDSPLDDIYIVVLYHNNEPIMVYKYTLLGKQVYHLSATSLSGSGPIYTLATQVEKWIDNYKFALQPGFLPIKDYILEVLSGVREKGNLMAFCPALPSNDFLEAMLELLHGESQYDIISGTELMESWRKHGAGGIRLLCKKNALVFKQLQVLMHPDFLPLLAELDSFMANSKKTFYLFEQADVLSCLLKRLFHSADLFEPDRRLLVPDYEPSDLVHIVNTHLLDEHLCRMKGVTMIALNDLIIREEELFSTLGEQELKNWIDNRIIPLINQPEDDEDEETDCGFKLVSIDFDIVGLPTNTQTAYEECMAELNTMVGLDELKSRLNTLFNRMRFDQMRKNMGLPALDDNRLHMIFTGNPGTGKTTVARIMGKIFKELGVLSNGEVITAERADMVGKYIGHTEDTMKELIERAKGNVLFIDEAYSLSDGNRGDRTDYGYRAIECLLGVLANNDSDLIVIMAGYEKEMKQLLESNPGLRGRFAYMFHFDDFTEEQLLEICMKKLHEKRFFVEATVKDTIQGCIRQTVSVKDDLFHNARWAEQFVMQGIVSAMADRLCSSNRQADFHELCRITDSDVLRGYELTRPAGKEVRRQVGFKRA